MRDCIWIRSKAKSLVWLSSSTSSRKGPRANLLFQLLCLSKRFLSLEIKRKSPENRLRFVAVFSIAVVDGWKEDSLGSRARVHSLISFVYSLFPLSLSLFLSSALFSPIAFSALGRQNLLWFSSTTMISGRICCGVPLRLPNMNSWTLPFVSFSLLLFFSDSRRSVILCRLEY